MKTISLIITGTWLLSQVEKLHADVCEILAGETGTDVVFPLSYLCNAGVKDWKHSALLDWEKVSDDEHGLLHQLLSKAWKEGDGSRALLIHHRTFREEHEDSFDENAEQIDVNDVILFGGDMEDVASWKEYDGQTRSSIGDHSALEQEHYPLKVIAEGEETTRKTTNTTLYLKVKIDIQHPVGDDLGEILHELDFDFTNPNDDVEVTDQEIVDWEEAVVEKDDEEDF